MGLGGLGGLEKDAPRPGRTPTITPAKVQEVIRRTTQEKPANSTHWSTRTMAEAAGVRKKRVPRLSHKHGLKPPLSPPFKGTNDPPFPERLGAIVALYLNPPQQSTALSVHEQ